MHLTLAGMTEATAKTYIEAIEQQAIAKFGEKNWLPDLVRAYVQILQEQGHKDATYETRRSHVRSIFKKSHTCTLDTAIALAQAVGCRFNMECKVIKEEFESVL